MGKADAKIQRLFNYCQKSAGFILNLIFPIECLGCGQSGEWLCEKCFSKLKLKSEYFCPKCKKKTKYGKVCQKCKPNCSLDGILAANDYKNQTIVKLIKSLKYYFAKDIALILGNYLSLLLKNSLSQSRLSDPDGKPKIFSDFYQTIIMPVPLHKKRLRWRGFNQSYSLALSVAENFNLQINSEQLIRIKHKKPQAKLKKNRRPKNIKGCFAWQGNKLRGQNIILIDDVATTCSTLEECAKVLKQNNAGEVWGMVVAQG